MSARKNLVSLGTNSPIRLANSNEHLDIVYRRDNQNEFNVSTTDASFNDDFGDDCLSTFNVSFFQCLFGSIISILFFISHFNRNHTPIFKMTLTQPMRVTIVCPH